MLQQYQQWMAKLNYIKCEGALTSSTRYQIKLKQEQEKKKTGLLKHKWGKIVSYQPANSTEKFKCDMRTETEKYNTLPNSLRVISR